LIPELEFPTLSIITTYNGAAAEEVESRVTKVIEERVSTISRLENLY
jgi:HAE1 family hydrophobic/amphiphilic exporter-1